MWRQTILPILVSILALFGVKISKQPITYAGGIYTNLCGSGLTARLHWCSQECTAEQGSCNSQKNWVVKWTCDGRLTDCTDNEMWGHTQSVVDTACGKTVTIDVFDRNCRENGWSCTEANLKDYLVWYSGDCPSASSGSATPSATPKVTLSPSVKPTILPTIAPTLKPTVQPTAGPTLTLKIASQAAVAVTTPKTGDDRWIWGIFFLGALAFGLILWDNARHLL